jgi:hypothetical protein
MPSSEYWTSETGDALQASARPFSRFRLTRRARPFAAGGVLEVLRVLRVL